MQECIVLNVLGPAISIQSRSALFLFLFQPKLSLFCRFLSVLFSFHSKICIWVLYSLNLSTSKSLSKVDLSYLFHDSFNIVNESISYSGFNMKHCTTKMNASRFLQNIQIPTSFFHEITKPINIEIIGAYKWILALANHLKCLVGLQLLPLYTHLSCYSYLSQLLKPLACPKCKYHRFFPAFPQCTYKIQIIT